MRAFPSEDWCQQNLHEGSETQPFRAQILPNIRVNYQRGLVMPISIQKGNFRTDA